MGGTKKLSKLGTECRLHAIMALIEWEMCINFAHLYLHDEYNKNKSN